MAVTPQSVKALATTHPDVLIKFSIVPCKGCDNIQPYYEWLASQAEFKNVVFVHVANYGDIWDKHGWNIQRFPTFVWLHNGKVVDSVETSLPDKLLKFIYRHTKKC